MYFTQCDETTYKFMFNTPLGIGERFIKRPFFYTKFYCDSDIAKG